MMVYEEGRMLTFCSPLSVFHGEDGNNFTLYVLLLLLGVGTISEEVD